VPGSSRVRQGPPHELRQTHPPRDRLPRDHRHRRGSGKGLGLGYAGIKGEGREVGGFAKGKVSKGGPLIVLYSKKLEDSVARVKKAGGKICKPIFDFPGDRRFHFTDPAGNSLGVWGA